MNRLGVTESYKLKRQVVISASEAAEMILRYVHSLTIETLYNLCSQGRRHLAGDTQATRSSLRGHLNAKHDG